MVHPLVTLAVATLCPTLTHVGQLINGHHKVQGTGLKVHQTHLYKSEFYVRSTVSIWNSPDQNTFISKPIGVTIFGVEISVPIGFTKVSVVVVKNMTVSSSCEFFTKAPTIHPVSYTHLTLPTKRIV